MWRIIRDAIVVGCAVICAGASVYIVYNVERFKRLYEVQFLNQPDPEHPLVPAPGPLRHE
jgi:hypothetical protein